MLKFKKTRNNQEVSPDSVDTHSSVQKDLSPSQNLLCSENEKIEQQPIIEDSYIESIKDAGSDFQVKLNARPQKAFFTKTAGQSSGVLPKTQSKDARGINEQQSQKDYSEMSRNLFEPGEESQSKSTNTLESPDKKLYKSETDDSQNTDKCSGENIKEDPRQTPSLDSCTRDTTPITSSIEPETEHAALAFGRCWSLIKELKGQLVYCWRNSRCRKQFIQGSLFYVFWFIASLVCAVLIVRLENKDGPACILAVIIWCCAVTLFLERGYFTYWLDQKALQESTTEGDINDPSCHNFCLCCNVEDALLEQRQSQYTRTRGEKNTVFVCEVTDVSSINPSDCPQMKTVEQTGEDSPSSDHRPARSKLVKAIVHCSETEVEENSSISQCDCPGACACPRQYKKKIAKVTPRHPKTSDKVFLIGESDAQEGSSDEISPKQNWKRKDTSPMRRPSRKDVFMCEYHGQGVACACADFVHQSPLHSTNSEDLPAYEKYDHKGEVERHTPRFSSSSNEVFDCQEASAHPKQHKKKVTNVTSKHPKKNQQMFFVGEPDE